MFRDRQRLELIFDKYLCCERRSTLVILVFLSYIVQCWVYDYYLMRNFEEVLSDRGVWEGGYSIIKYGEGDGYFVVKQNVYRCYDILQYVEEYFALFRIILNKRRK